MSLLKPTTLIHCDLCRKHDSDLTSQEINLEDPGDILEEAGEEWPDFEESGVARQREFYQCCCGVVQGDYPIERGVAVEVCMCVCVYVARGRGRICIRYLLR